MTENPSGSDTGSGGADLDKQQAHLFHLTAAEASRYLPRGSFHYFENGRDDQDLTVLTAM